MKMINLRKVILINKKFQLTIISWMLLLGIMSSSFIYSANMYFFKHMKDEAEMAGLSVDNIIYQYIDSQKIFMTNVFIITALVTIFVIVIGGLYMSHRVAGPLYRLTQHLKQNNPQDCTPIKFRKGDFFLEIQNEFNEFLKRKSLEKNNHLS